MIPKEAKNFFQEKKNVLTILTTAIKAIKRGNFLVLKNLSDRTIHSASIYQDPDSITIAVLIYALSRIFERSKYSTYEDWPVFSQTCIKELVKAKNNFKKERIEEFRRNLQEIRKIIGELSSHLKKYIGEVFRRAMIKKASRLYEHGISLQQTAELLGISTWELSEYAGKTGIGDVNLGVTTDIETRIKKALNLFK